LEEAFQDITKKKPILWQEIEDNMKAKGHHTTVKKLKSKWGNLLKTYRANVDTKNRSGSKSVSWVYFDRIDSVLGKKAASNVPKENLGATFKSPVSSQFFRCRAWFIKRQTKMPIL
jgi:hypothetical protein